MAVQDGVAKISRVVATATRLRTDVGTAEVVESFERAGITALLLKGPAIARWLYPDGAARTYVDSDLLVGPADFDAAEQVLRSLGYVSTLGELGMPAWWCEHAAVWQRHDDGQCVDLHRKLIGVRVDEAAAWRVLSADAEELVVAGYPVPTLALPARAMHVALHAAQHAGDGWPSASMDLERVLTVGDDDLWRAAAARADVLRAMPAFVAGLRGSPAGRQLIARLGLPDARSVETELRAGSPPLALGFEQLAQAPGMRARAAILSRKLAPTPAFMRASDPRARDGRIGLARAYRDRTIRLVRSAPRGLYAWYRVRRSVRGALR